MASAENALFDIGSGSWHARQQPSRILREEMLAGFKDD